MSDQLATLKRYQAWRRGDESAMLDPSVIGESIDYAIQVCEAAETLAHALEADIKLEAA